VNAIGGNNTKVIKIVVLVDNVAPLMIKFSGSTVEVGDNGKNIMSGPGIDGGLLFSVIKPDGVFNMANNAAAVASGL